MNIPSSSSQSRLARLAQLVVQDPGNVLLLADASEAALAAGDLESAERYLTAGHHAEPHKPAWRYRLANLRIAQRRLPEAREILSSLQSEGPPHPSISHNLAYVSLLAGDFEASAQILQPWISGASPSGPQAGAIQSLWLQAMHHADRLNEAWAWVEALPEGALTEQAAGVAALIAVDRSRLDAAERMSSKALRADPGHVEALIARACVLMGKGQTQAARAALDVAVQKAPHQARAWSTLGFVDILEMKPELACAHFEKAVSAAPDDATSFQGLGWACILQSDLQGAAHAFERAVELDPEWGEGHGGLAVALAMAGQDAQSQTHVEKARNLQRGSVAARYAKAIMSGQPEGLQGVQRLAQQIIGKLAANRARPDVDDSGSCD